jgi:hypothetical protein
MISPQRRWGGRKRPKLWVSSECGSARRTVGWVLVRERSKDGKSLWQWLVPSFCASTYAMWILCVIIRNLAVARCRMRRCDRPNIDVRNYGPSSPRHFDSAAPPRAERGVARFVHHPHPTSAVPELTRDTSTKSTSRFCPRRHSSATSCPRLPRKQQQGWRRKPPPLSWTSKLPAACGRPHRN